MSEICVRSDFLLGLLEEVGRNRALKDHETDIVEEIVGVDRAVFKWSPRMDGALLRAARTPGGIARFARIHGITGMSAYCRIHRIRRKRREGAGKGDKG